MVTRLSHHFPMHVPTMQYLALLSGVAKIFDILDMWRLDAVLHGQICLKLSCLHEARADQSLGKGMPLTGRLKDLRYLYLCNYVPCNLELSHGHEAQSCLLSE